MRAGLRQFLRIGYEWAKAIALVLVLWSLIRTFVVEAFKIPSGSMQNTLLVGDFLFVNKFLYGAEVPLIHKKLPAVREPERGDIIIFDGVEDAEMKIVKRLIGIPGDTVQMINGVVYLNGAVLNEPYTTPVNLHLSANTMQRMQMRRWQVPHYVGGQVENYHPDLHDWGPLVVPQDSLFVMGDNRDGSYDGRYWGFLPRVNVLGRPIVVYFSINVGAARSLISEVRWKRLFHAPR